MTDNEIMQALECCKDGEELHFCSACPLYKHNPDDDFCKENLSKNALDLINRQRAEIADERAKWDNVCDVIARQDKEIEDLKGQKRVLVSFWRNENKKFKAAKAEAINEFAERLCEGRVSNGPVVIATQVLVKEMTEDRN